MNYSQMQQIADDHKLGNIHWESKIALNTGKPFEVGYIYLNGSRTLFCKRNSDQKDFYLCNEFRELDCLDNIRVHVSYSNGMVSAVPVNEQQASKLENNGNCVVPITKDKLAAWNLFVSQLHSWNEYWKETTRNWYRDNPQF